ncbi:MAG: hypothetical protein E3J90_02045 [Promethearchaeota archaeon]|nr:MAG: hypothetical protein E3J90_02045 [Candidatus Lokiarchaeota archaeon]
MKRQQKLALALFSTLILLSFVNSSMAAPPSYVGVATGDEFVWVPTVNLANINTTGIALFGEDNWTIAYNMILDLYENSTGMDFGSFSGAGIKVVVKDVSDEITVAPGIFASGLTIDIHTSAGLNNWTLVANNTVMGIYDPNSLNETTAMAALSGIPLIMAKGFNYSMITNAFNTMIAADPSLNGNLTVQAQGIGFKITLLSSFLEAAFNSTGAPFDVGTLGDVVINLRWNSNGVFESGSIVYGGLTIASIQLIPSDDLIPGFEIATIIGVSIVTILSIIYLKRKKNILN